MISSFKALTAVLTLSLAAEALKLVPSTLTGLKTYEPYGGKDAEILSSPADWNRNTFPIPIHSHNDYQRTVPVFEALSYGARSIKSDVWLNPSDGKLYVGHDPFSLSRERTFQALTVEPLIKAISQANSANSLYSSSPETGYFAELQQSLKTNTSQTWNRYYSLELEPLRKKGYLTRYENGKIIKGPILIIGTGNTPVGKVAPIASQDYFIDGPLGALDNTITMDGQTYEWNSTLCPIASGSFVRLVGEYSGVEEASDEVKANISRPIEQAHAKGIQSRYWESPQWPIFARDRVNALMLAASSDWIGSDDLGAIVKF